MDSKKTGIPAQEELVKRFKKETPRTGPARSFTDYIHDPWICTAALALLVTLVFSGFLFSDKMLFSSDQLGGLDAKVFLHDAIAKHHQFPFWFSPRLGGMPTIDALFGDAFYPPSIIINGLLPVHRAIGVKMILHIFLAGLFFFLMLYRGFRIAAPLACAGGAFYMLNPEFFSHVYPGHDGKMIVIAWLPFIVWRLKALADSRSILNATLLGLGIAAALLSSQVQLTYFVLWGLFLYAVFAIVMFLRKKEKAAALRFGLLFCLAVGLGLGLGFVQLFPSFMYVREAFSVRGVDRGFAYAASWSLHWPEILSLWVPEFVNTLEGYWSANAFKLNSEYAGGVALLLACLAVSWKRRPWRWFWAGIVIFSALFALGAHTPVFRIAYAVIPGVRKFRASSMIIFWFSFGTILLALLFLKDMLHGFGSLTEAQRKKRFKALLVTIAALFGVALLFSIKDLVAAFPFVAELDTEKRRIFDDNFSRNFLPCLWLWFFFAATTIGLVMAVLNGKVKPGAAIAVIAVMGCVDVLRIDAKFVKLIDPRPYFYTEPALEKIAGEAAAAPLRVFSLPETLPQNGEGVRGLEAVGGFHDNELRWYREFRGDQQDRNYFTGLLGFTQAGEPFLKAEAIDKGNGFLDIANVKYLLARNNGEVLAFENRNALGRVSYVPGYLVLDSTAVAPALQRSGYDWRKAVALNSEPKRKGTPGLPDSIAAAFSARWERYTPNERTVSVTVPADGFLRISEVYYPGWTVSVDGRRAEIMRADLAWMAINISKGTHTVVMTLRSLYFGTAVAVSLATLAVLCLLWTVAALRKRRS